MPGALVASLLLVVRPGAPSSFLLLVAMPGAPSRLRAQGALASGSLLGPRDQAATARGVWCPKRYHTLVASLVPLVASAPCFLAPRVHG